MTFVQTILCTAMDPNGVNVPLRRHMLRFAFEQMGIDDVGHAVEECIPDEADGRRHRAAGQAGDRSADGVGPGRQHGRAVTPAVAAIRCRAEGDPANVKRTTTVDGKPTDREQEWIPAELRQTVEEFERETAARFRGSSRIRRCSRSRSSCRRRRPVTAPARPERVAEQTPQRSRGGGGAPAQGGGLRAGRARCRGDGEAGCGRRAAVPPVAARAAAATILAALVGFLRDRSGGRRRGSRRSSRRVRRAGG
jgi:hypothetical protein